MEKITTIGLDIAKHAFQVHAVNDAGAVVARRKLRRDDVVSFFRGTTPLRGRHRGLRNWSPLD